MTEETLTFQAEVSKLLKIVANSLYSRREVFLRELISNASDACDRLRYEALTSPKLIEDNPHFSIKIQLNTKTKTISIEDNGIGMSRNDLVENLGTIARSGSSKFLEQMTGDETKDIGLIGQFGVGFYSAFIVANQVEVISRKAGEKESWKWSSDGEGEFQISQSEKPHRGTSVILHLRKEAKEFLDPQVIRNTVKTHSDHIGIPIVFIDSEEEESLNIASALWTRPKSEINKESYKEFYQQISHSFDDPWSTIHIKAEGRLEFTMLLFIPSSRPFDLFQADRKCPVKLYVRRVFVTNDCEGLIPSYLRFVRGVIDTEDIALNVSREMLQQDPILKKISDSVVKKILSDLSKKSKKNDPSYIEFWKNFGAVLKEGIYEDPSRHEQILPLSRFHSTYSDELITLDDYVSRMHEKQDSIYFISGDEINSLRSSPQLEGYVARNLEVLILSDPVDEFWIPTVGNYKNKKFISVMRGDAELSELPLNENKDSNSTNPADLALLSALIKQTLGDTVKNVRTSERLTTSPVCLVADESDPDRHLARILNQHGKLDKIAPGVLELNPDHNLIKLLSKSAKDSGNSVELKDAAQILLDQAKILEGDLPENPAEFAKRLTKLLEKNL